ncbi:MAG: MFS transporter, partial [Pelagibacteraceae bacterium]
SSEPTTVNATSNIKNWKRSEVLKDMKFYFLLPAVLCPAFLITGIFINQSIIFESKHWSTSLIAPSFTTYAVVSVISLQVSGYLIDKFTAIKILPYYLLPLILGFFVSTYYSFHYSPILFFALIAITSGTSNVLLTSTWSEIYGTKYLGAIRSVTVSFMVFSTSLAPFLFGHLIDLQLKMDQILLFMGVYAVLTNLLFLFKIKSYKPINIS